MEERNTDFDRLIDRRGSGCLKYDFAAVRGKRADILPMWVADMDFQTTSYVQDALIRQAQHGIYGYDETGEHYFETVAGWVKRQLGWKVEQEWLVKTPGVVFALAMAVKAFSEKGDGVMINQPVYYPFRNVILSNGRRVVNSPLRYENGTYALDFEQIEKKIVEEKVGLYILCSPHNPVGRVWSRKELGRLDEICRRHNVFVVSDEIHSDFIHKKEHTCFAAVSAEAQQNCMVCTSPGKTFNLAGLQISNIWIPDDDRREKFSRQIEACGYSQVNSAGIAACQAAYESGYPWYKAMLSYVEENIAYFQTFVRARMDKAHVVPTEGTYLVWVDLRDYGLSEEEMDRLLSEEAGVWLDPGSMFGEEGRGFFRFNLACPRSTVELALNQIATALKKLA